MKNIMYYMGLDRIMYWDTHVMYYMGVSCNT